MMDDKIAFLVLAHNEEYILNMLVNHLNCIGDVYIHLDAKADDDKFKNIQGTFIKNRVDVAWAGWSMIEATMALAKCAMEKKTYTKYVILSGQDYPIKNLSLIKAKLLEDDKNIINCVSIFDNKNQEQYINHVERKYNYDVYRFIKNKTFARILRYVVNKLLSIRKNDIDGINIYHGSQWCVLNHSSLQYCLEKYHSNGKLIEVLKNSFAPDEYFFQTLLSNSKDVDHQTTPIITDKIGTHLKANVHIIDESLSKYYTIDDLDEILQSDKLFVRKVNDFESRSLLCVLDEKING